MAVASDSPPPASAPSKGPAKGWAQRGGALSLAQRFLTLREGSIILVTLIAFVYFSTSTSRFVTGSGLKALLPYFAPFAIMAAGDAVESREVDRLTVVGQTHSEAVFEIIGRTGELTEQQRVLLAQYAEGLAAYRARRWDDARRAFQAALEAVPGDGPSMAMAQRVENFQANPPAADWDGAWHLDQK